MLNELKEWGKSIAVAIILALIIRGFFMESFIVDGRSMEPTFINQERVLVNKFIYNFRDPDFGDIVVFPYPVDEERVLIKRVIGTANDKIEIKNGALFINKEPVTEEYILQGYSGQNYGPVNVPEGMIFVLGDNRSNSVDSRNNEVGFISTDDVRGKTFLRYWPLSQLNYFAVKQ
ncbi:signal peptidase I [Proteinivorax hydrogeniformans]|uniref:Signal peptidase I n=1 Tax=Proteinivorax hydrogeniformans TaxID=1826727 RepID=A0AAU8HPB8_9FIRM